jgi:tRNA A37 threonylcarbamoyladenosine synthetase subunit TsaC/SUA5/YrdC
MFSSSASQWKPVTAIRADYEFAIAFRVPHHPHLLYLLHRAGWSDDAVAATSFTTAALIGTALALEVQAIASPAARLRKKSVLRMNVSPDPRR